MATREQELVAEHVSLRRGFATLDPPALDGTCLVTIPGGDSFTVNEDGTVLDNQTNELLTPLEEE